MSEEKKIINEEELEKVVGGGKGGKPTGGGEQWLGFDEAPGTSEVAARGSTETTNLKYYGTNIFDSNDPNQKGF